MSRKTLLLLMKMALAVSGVLALAVALRGQGLDTGRPAADPSRLMAGAGWVLASGVPLGLRMGRMLAVWGVFLPARQAIRISYQSIFYLVFTPMALGMEVSRFAKIRPLVPGTRKRRLAAALLSDRAVGVAVFCLLAVAAFPQGLLGSPSADDWRRWGVMAVCALALGAVAAWALWRNELFGRLPGLQHAVRGHARSLGVAASLSLVVSLSLLWGIFQGALGFGLPVSFGQVVFVTSASMLAQAVPVSLLGLTATEAATVALWAGMGLSQSQAALMAVLVYGSRLLLALAGGLWEFAHSGLDLVLREDRVSRGPRDAASGEKPEH